MSVNSYAPLLFCIFHPFPLSYSTHFFTAHLSLSLPSSHICAHSQPKGNNGEAASADAAVPAGLSAAELEAQRLAKEEEERRRVEAEKEAAEEAALQAIHVVDAPLTVRSSYSSETANASYLEVLALAPRRSRPLVSAFYKYEK